MVQELTTPSAKAVGHTPLPWKVEAPEDELIHWPGDLERHRYIGYGNLHKIVQPLKIWTDNGDGTYHTIADVAIDEPANAAFIVRACNSHYQLLEALKGLLGFLPDRADALDYAAGNDGRVGKIHVAVSKAYQAISAAEEGL